MIARHKVLLSWLQTRSHLTEKAFGALALPTATVPVQPHQKGVTSRQDDHHRPQPRRETRRRRLPCRRWWSSRW